MRRAAWIYAALTAVVVAFHAAVILGAPLGDLTMGGRWPGVLPWQGRLASALSMALLAVLTGIVLARAGLLRWRLPGWTIWAVVAVQAVAVVEHLVTPSPAERALWLPVIVVMLACAVVVARRRG